MTQIENHPPPETFEACLMHNIPDGNPPNEKHFFTQLSTIYDIETKEVRLGNVIFAIDVMSE